MQVTLILK